MHDQRKLNNPCCRLPLLDVLTIHPLVSKFLIFFRFLGNAALVDTLVAKTRGWEEDRGISFTYDGVPLLAMLDEYAMLRQDREEEKRRMRVRFT